MTTAACDQKDATGVRPALEKGISLTSRRLAATLYTRGLWTPVQAWRTLIPPPYTEPPLLAGLSEQFLRKHLRKASLAAVGSSAFIAAAAISAAGAGSDLLAVSALWLLSIQWLVLPWYFARKIFKYNSTANHAACHVFASRPKLQAATADEDGVVEDLGFLLREARFSIDSTKRYDDEKAIGEMPDTECIYAAVEKALQQNAQCFVSKRLMVVNKRGCSLRPFRWQQAVIPDKVGVSRPFERLVLFTNRVDVDGLAVVELAVRHVNPHLALEIRQRWLPPLEARFCRQELTAREKGWWRCGVVPGLLMIVSWLAYLLLGEVAGYALAFLPEDAPVQAFFASLSLDGGVARFMGAVVFLVLTLPLVWLAAVSVKRIVRFLLGSLYALTGTVMEVRHSRPMTFRRSNLEISEDAALKWGLSLIQVMEEVVTNAVIDCLKKHNIDTHSIRQELQMFSNNGIYLTGGTLSVENAVFGHKVNFWSRGRARRQARAGKLALASSINKS
jgi:hypothetical protein